MESLALLLVTDLVIVTMKIYLICTGVGTISRGIETFARECFDGLQNTDGLEIELFKGSGIEADNEHTIWNLPRNGKAAYLLGKMIRRNSYVVEQLSALLSIIPAIKKGKPDIIFYSDSNLGFQLYRWRKSIGVPYKLLFSNGGPCDPPFSRTDHVQQVAPYYQEMAVQAGEPASKHSLVPYGINVPSGMPLYKCEERNQLRGKLRLPLDRPVVLSVGWISAYHKRMDYLIGEIAALPHPRPFLVMLGHMDENSPPILERARQMLGSDNFLARSVPYEQVTDYYQSADIFTLAALKEGFGRVYLEALIHGLPCIVHDHPVMRYVLGKEGSFQDLSKSGSLAQAISDELQKPNSPETKSDRRNYVRQKFSWEILKPAYMQMFRNCLAR